MTVAMLLVSRNSRSRGCLWELLFHRQAHVVDVVGLVDLLAQSVAAALDEAPGRGGTCVSASVLG